MCLLTSAVMMAGVALAADQPPATASAFLKSFFKVARINPPLDLGDISVNHAPDGEQVMVSDYKNKWVVLNIWATWCPPCVEELPKLDKFKQMADSPKFALLTVSVDHKQTAERVAAFLHRGDLAHLEPLHDTGRNLENAVDVSQLPVNYVINPAGRAIAVLYGPADWASPGARDFVTSLRVGKDVFKGYVKRSVAAGKP